MLDVKEMITDHAGVYVALPSYAPERIQGKHFGKKSSTVGGQNTLHLIGFGKTGKEDHGLFDPETNLMPCRG